MADIGIAPPPMLIEVLPSALELARYVSFVGDASAGAVATFMGTTRDSFQGKQVLRLEYEAYEPMAVRKMQVCQSTTLTFRSCLCWCADLFSKSMGLADGAPKS